MVREFSWKENGEEFISKNFKVCEFRCKDGSDKILIDIDFVKNKLQLIRDYFNFPVIINSAYRTATYNKKVGGAAKSYHLLGQAFDIIIRDVEPHSIAFVAEKLDIKGIIQYNTFVHLDSRLNKYWARDNNGKITIISHFV